MKNIKLAVLLIVPATALGMEQDGKHLIFEMAEVLLEPKSATTVVQELGAKNIALAKLGGCKITDPEQELFALLTPPSTREPLIMRKGNPTPQVVCNWIAGSQPCAQLVKQADAEIEEGIQRQLAAHTGWGLGDAFARRTIPLKEPLYKQLARCILDPEENAKIMQPVPELMELVAQAQQQGYTPWLLTHWNHESMDQLVKEYPNSFAPFAGRIYTSGEHKMLKQGADDTCLYQTFFEKTGLDSSECAFVETDRVHLASLMAYQQREALRTSRTILLEPEKTAENKSKLQQAIDSTSK